MKSKSRFEFLPRPSVPRRGAVALIALGVCGFVVPTALATRPPNTPTPPQPIASVADGAIAATAPAVAAAPDPVATATTDQSAGSTATATQQQPTNVVVIVRVNSPGDDGSITQNNLAVGTSSVANDAATTQGGIDAAAPTQLGTSTAQQASSTATATQDDAGNLVVTVRIGSPGQDGAVAQTNGVVGASSATNASETAQPVAAPPLAVQPQARRSGAASSRRPPQRRHPRPDAAARAPVESLSTPVAAADTEPTTATPDRAARPPAPAHRHPVVARRAGRGKQGVAALTRLAAGATRVLSPFIPHASPVEDAARPEDVSGAVLLTLLVLAAAAGTFVFLRRVPVWRRAASWRLPR